MKKIRKKILRGIAVIISAAMLLPGCTNWIPEPDKGNTGTPSNPAETGYLIELGSDSNVLPSKALYSIAACIPEEDSDYGLLSDLRDAGFSRQDYGAFSISMGGSKDIGYGMQKKETEMPNGILACGYRPSPVIASAAYRAKSMAGPKAAHSFQVDDIWEDVGYFDENGYARTADYECVMITGSAYIMVDASYPSPDMGRISEIAYRLDEKKAGMEDLFGPVFDYDGNGRIIIAFSRLGESTLGYVYSGDMQPKEIVSDSNEADMLYLSVDALSNDRIYGQMIPGALHEYQHLLSTSSMIWNGRNGYQPLWVDEGLSMLAEYYSEEPAAAERASAYAAYFMKTSGGKSLIEFNDSAYDYAASLMFMHYMRTRFGDGFIKRIYAAENTGYRAIEAAAGMDFGELVSDFARMLISTGRGITDDPRYNAASLSPVRGSAEYSRLGFSIRETMDEAFSSSWQPASAIEALMKPYSFMLIPWYGLADSLEYSSSGERIRLFTACRPQG